jgi:hypothetical protein
MDKFKKINKGGRGYGSFEHGDELEFLKPERATGPWFSDYSGASETGTYQSRRFDDNSGPFRGSNHDDSESHGLVQKLSDEHQASIRDIGSLIDNQEDWGSGNKLTGGGGPVSDNERDPRDSSWRGRGDKGPRYSNPLGQRGQGNMRGWKK